MVHLETDSESGTAGGVATLARWVFATPWVVRPYVEAGLGILAGNFNLRQTNCDINFIIEGGASLLWFFAERTALTASYRFQAHLEQRQLRPEPGDQLEPLHPGCELLFPMTHFGGCPG